MTFTNGLLNDYLGFYDALINDASATPVTGTSLYGTTLDVNNIYYSTNATFGNPYSGWDN